MRVDGYALIGVYELKVKSGLKGKEGWLGVKIGVSLQGMSFISSRCL